MPLLILLALLAGSQPARAEGDPVVQPERSTSVIVSNRDVNRIACPGTIGDVVWSQERPVKIQVSGSNVFVKYLNQQEGDKVTVSTVAVDLHVVCDDTVYTMDLHPTAVDSVTVRLAPVVSKAIREVIKNWGELPFEQKIEKVTLAMYHDDLPEGFQRQLLVEGDPRRHVRLYDGLHVTCDYQLLAEGIGLIGKECELITDQPTEFREADFLNRALGDVVAVTIDPLKVLANQPARLFVVERSVSHAD